MTFLPRTSSSRRRAAAGHRTHVVPVRDVEWDRPVFRPPQLPSFPPSSEAAPFTAMRPLRPTRRGTVELGF
ncbi:MAG TPA: hypothetical protein VMD31_07785 [Opitutaceae bacterium]|nr:hypothetical protein [Opitutaceae bacterium]